MVQYLDMQLVKLISGSVLVFFSGNFMFNGIKIISNSEIRAEILPDVDPGVNWTAYGIIVMLIGLIGVLGGLYIVRKTMKRKS